MDMNLEEEDKSLHLKVSPSLQNKVLAYSLKVVVCLLSNDSKYIFYPWQITNQSKWHQGSS